MEWILGISVMYVLLGLACSIFWVWMLIDCLANQHEDKLVWFLVLFFLNLPGAFLYFWLARRKRLLA